MQGHKNDKFRGGIDGFITPRNKPAPQVRPTLSYQRPPQTPVQPRTPQISNTPENYPLPSNAIFDDINKAPVQKTKKKSRRKKILLSILALVIIMGGVFSWYGANILASLDGALHGDVFSDVHALFVNTKLKGESQGRVNILLAGDSSDDPGHQGADLTDSIMVVSIDTRNHSGFMLSIPRDLWVNVPGQGQAKINTANTVSNFSESGYPSGGMGQLQQIVQTDLGIPIDYYALINYQAFKQAVDAVGGISIDIQSPDPRGIYDAYTHLSLPNGNDFLNGQEALNLARARGDNAAGDRSYGFPQSDFDRTMHQRQMLVALSEKAKTIGVLADPFKATSLFKSFTSNLNTNLNLADILRLNQITKGLNLSKLQSLTYPYGGNNSLLSDYTSPDGQEALIPTEGIDEFGQLRQYYQKLTSDNPVVREAPSIVVLNGTSTNKLAHNYATKLTPNGFNVLGSEDANNLYNSTMIIDNVGNSDPAALKFLKGILPRDTTVVTTDAAPAEATEAQGYNANFIIVLGQDASASNVQNP